MKDFDDIALNPAQRRYAARACFAGATIALAASLFALLPLWVSPVIGHLPLLRVVLFLLAICQTAGVCLSALLWGRMSRGTASGSTSFASVYTESSALSYRDAFASGETQPVSAPGRWWTDSALRQENRRQIGR